MPGRKAILANNQFYHVFNKGIAAQPIFLDSKDYKRAVKLIFYYQNQNLPFKYSDFRRKTRHVRSEIIADLKQKENFLVEILAYCLMPNHFHLLVKQKKDSGISKFLGDFQNSYTRYFNVKNNRKGSLLQGKFKAVRVETGRQLIHVERYIHLNPCTSYVVRNMKDLENYEYSSFPEYLGKRKSEFCVCNKEDVLSYFENLDDHKRFVFDQADYQRHLQNIKHLILENY